MENKCQVAIEDYWQINVGTAHPWSEWEAFKAVMRGTIIHAIASHRAELRERETALGRAVTEAEMAYAERPDDTTRGSFLEAQRNYTLHLTKYTKKRLLSKKQTVFAEGDKNGRALAFLARTETSQTVVASIQSPTGEMFSDPGTICQQFQLYYTQLYQSRSGKSVKDCRGFLDGLSLPSLSRLVRC